MNKKKNTKLAKGDTSLSALVVRSAVPANLNYSEYRPYLRKDFYYSCAYCTIAESEAEGISFEIDHYEPQKARPELKNNYSNLMYSCETCNQRKGDRCPPAAARVAGYRFFRPDCDQYEDHFEKSGVLLKERTTVGYFSIQALDLNREPLRRLRDIRKRLTDCDKYVSEGVLALKKFPLDKLPQQLKGRAFAAIKKAEAIADELADNIDDILRGYAKSSILEDPAGDQAQINVRQAQLALLEAMFPGTWRHRSKKRKKSQ